MGIYQGGSKLDINYNLSGRANYKYTTQLREQKVLSSNERTLQTRRNDSTALKFNGSLDVDSSPNELNKEEFQTSVKEIYRHYGLQTFFFAPKGGRMLDLSEEYHMFTLEELLAEYNTRLICPPPVYDPLSGNETPESIAARHRSYDEYELCDIALSRLAVESLVSPVLRQRVIARYDHMDDFEDVPGQIYLKMVMEACHASVSLDISSATSSLTSLSLSAFPGENISDFATEALRLLKILIAGSYSIDYQWGTKILIKVTNTSTQYFNLAMWDLFKNAKKMEDDWGPQRNSKEMSALCPGYDKYGPIAICNEMNKVYGDCCKANSWAAVSPPNPEANYGRHSQESRDDERRPSRSEDDPKCDTEEDASALNPHLGGAKWRYCVIPSDENAMFRQGDKVYMFCAKCKARQAKTFGFWNLTHTTKDHKGKSNKRNSRKDGDGKTDGQSNDKKDADGKGLKPSAMLTAANPSGAPDSKVKVLEEVHADDIVDPDPDGLVFADPETFLFGLQPEANVGQYHSNDDFCLPCCDSVSDDDDESYASLVEDDLWVDSVSDSSVDLEEYSDQCDTFYDAVELPYPSPILDGDGFFDRNSSSSTDDTIKSSMWSWCDMLYTYTLHGFFGLSLFMFTIFTDPLHLLTTLVSFGLSIPYLWSLWVSMLFWDTADLFLLGYHTASASSRRSRRFLTYHHRHLPSAVLLSFPRRWMILDSIQLPSGHCIDPLHRFFLCISYSIGRLLKLHDMVDLSISVLWQYNCLRYQRTFPSHGPSQCPSEGGGGDVTSPDTSSEPTITPTNSPSDVPFPEPMATPSTSPSDAPSTPPTDAPSTPPTDAPSTSPTDAPLTSPTDEPSSHSSTLLSRFLHQTAACFKWILMSLVLSNVITMEPTNTFTTSTQLDPLNLSSISIPRIEVDSRFDEALIHKCFQVHMLSLLHQHS